MSGGSSKKKTEKKEEPAPVQTYTQQAFMPGMDSMIAQQLGMGGYGDPSSLLSYMNSIQTPMQMPVLPTPGTPSPSTPPPTSNSRDDIRGSYERYLATGKRGGPFGPGAWSKFGQGE